MYKREIDTSTREVRIAVLVDKGALWHHGGGGGTVATTNIIKGRLQCGVVCSLSR